MNNIVVYQAKKQAAQLIYKRAFGHWIADALYHVPFVMQ